MAKLKSTKKPKRPTRNKLDISKRNVFISYHDCDADRPYKDRLIDLLKGKIFDKTIHDDDIDDDQLKVDTIQQKIRDEHVAEAEVTIVLIGRCTWKRKHVDWEIHASLRDTKNNPRNGSFGVLLDNHPDYGAPSVESRLIPPRLVDNAQGGDPFAKIYSWPKKRVTKKFLSWIEDAYERRNGHPPTNNRPRFGENQKGNCTAGWQQPKDYPASFEFS